MLTQVYRALWGRGGMCNGEGDEAAGTIFCTEGFAGERNNKTFSWREQSVVSTMV